MKSIRNYEYDWQKRGAVISGEEINIEKVANILIDDFRSGRLGRITLEN